MQPCFRKTKFRFSFARFFVRSYPCKISQPVRFRGKVGFLIRTRTDIGHTPRKFPYKREPSTYKQPFASTHIKPFYYILLVFQMQHFFKILSCFSLKNLKIYNLFTNKNSRGEIILHFSPQPYLFIDYFFLFPALSCDSAFLTISFLPLP